MKRYLLGGIVLTTILSLAPLTQAGANNYRGITASAAALDTTYAQIRTDLGNRSSTDALDALFITYSGECVLFATYGSRNGSRVQLDIFNIARIGDGWAWAGYLALNSNGAGMSLWTQANKALANAENQFSRDVKKH